LSRCIASWSYSTIEVTVLCDGVNNAVFQLIALFGSQISQNIAKNEEKQRNKDKKVGNKKGRNAERKKE
jgi:hypothetical protein